jgi:pseudaminic acid biosynthesis-associated methylase
MDNSLKPNEQEKFWSGYFGSDYIKRNKKKNILKNNFFFFKKIFSNHFNIKSLIEFGPNIGLNIMVLKNIFKLKFITAVEINKKACAKLRTIEDVKVFNESISNFIPKQTYDLVLVKGVLIHVNPNSLQKIYDVLYKSCKKLGYILIAEYYSPNPISIKYRGFKNKLFKRDFTGEFLKKFKKCNIIDYGFIYHKDKYPQDDLNWFLIKKNG